MKKIYFLALLLVSVTAFGQTYHNLSTSSLTQNWTAVGFIHTDDDWSNFPSIRGFMGQTLTTATGVDPQTVLNPSSAADDLDLRANQSAPASFTSGGVAEFEITNPVVALQGSGTADAPHLVFYLNTTGATSIRVQYKVRDVDDHATDNATQQVALQYRIGNTGNFINVPAGYIADATTMGTATQETNIDVVLPAAVENQAMVEIRVITTNAPSNDEWVGIDDIVISGTIAGGDVTPPVASTLSPADDAINVAINATATISFSETIQKGTGNILVKNSGTNAVVQTIDVTSATVTLSGNQASFALTLANSTGYYIEIPAGAFKDQANNNFAGILDNTTWNFTTIAAPSTGVIGTTYNFNSCSNFISQGFTTYNVTGPQVWTCTKFGRTYTVDPSADSAMEMNGFSGSSQLNEDWLISPKFDLTGTNIPLLDFYSKSRFDGNSLSLRVSTNYSGVGDPSAATWTTITGEFPAPGSDAWKLSDSLNLSAFKTANVYVAWVYTSTTSAASRWTLDDIKIYNSTVAPLPTMAVTGQLLDFREVIAGTNSTSRSFSFVANDVTSNVIVTAPASFEVSKDNVAFTNSIVYTPGEIAAGQKTVYVRYSPAIANIVNSGNITINSNGLNNSQVFVKGNSYPLSTSLNVANWNIEYFGSTSNGPGDETLQQANAKKVMDYLGADAYGISEVVDVTRFSNLVSSLNGGYSYVVADYCSSGSTASACASAQKTAFVYKTSMFSNVSTRALMKTSSTANTNWSSGRLPMLVTADVTKNGETRTMSFIVIHGKANTGTTAEQIDAYQRRKAGAQELKDTLDAFFASSNIILLGDFNDDLDRTIAPTTGADTVSSYQPIVVDSTDANHYASLSLILSRYGLSSTTNNPEMIDHVVISNELKPRYITYSATIYTDIEALAAVTDFANTTSDHYPVMTRYIFAVSDVTAPTLVSTDPPNNATNIPTSHTFRMNFSESVVPGTGNILVKKVSDGTVVATIPAASVTINVQQISFTVPGLQNSTAYYIEVPNTAIKDPSGNFYAGISGPTAWTFTTAAPADVTAPTVVSTNPANNATNVATALTMSITFNENIVAGTGNILVKKASDGTVVSTVNVTSATISGAQASWSVSGLQPSTAYYVEVPNTAFKDAANNAFAGITVPTGWTFTTSAATAIPQIDPSMTEFVIQPNPTADRLVFTFRPKAGKAAYRIYDLNGRLVHEESKSVGSSKLTETINISSLSSGTYLISILNNGYYTVQKFVKH